MNPPAADLISERFIRTVCKRLAEGKRVRRNLPFWGRLAIDRPLPFLCVYRRPGRRADPGTFRLVTSEASYLTCSALPRQREGIGRLVGSVAETLGGKYGEFLILEIWAAPPEGPDPDSVAPLRPGFRIYPPRESGHEALTTSFEEALRRIKLDGRRATVETVHRFRSWPRKLPPLLPADETSGPRALMYGLEVSPVFRHPETGEPFPRVAGELRRSLSVALRRFFYQFTRTSTTAHPLHFHALGRQAVVKAVWEVDTKLAEVSDAYEFLLQLTPVNTQQAWKQFERNRFERIPTLHYRPLPVDPVVLKRGMFKVPVERIEDPALAMIFREKLYELDRQITMFQDRNTPRFLHESIQLFGGVDGELFGTAVSLLETIPPRSREASSGGTLNAEAFARVAREEIDHLRLQHPGLTARVEIRPDVTGLLVSKGNLLVSSDSKIPGSRVEALVQHEIGTHSVTYHNGRAQKLRILSTGLTGYDTLQEGLAVLAEYLVGGLSRPRLRLLAGRVVAVRLLIDGASFIDTFRELQKTHGFASRTAFTVTVRTYRSGGLTKDAVYLLGLIQILKYIKGGGELEPLFVGKMATEHIPTIRELTWRGVITPPLMIPRYLHRPESAARLKELRKGLGVLDLLERKRA